MTEFEELEQEMEKLKELQSKAETDEEKQLAMKAIHLCKMKFHALEVKNKIKDLKYPAYFTPVVAGDKRNNGLRLATIKVDNVFESTYVFDDGMNFGVTHKKTESDVEGGSIIATYVDTNRYTPIEQSDYDQLLAYVVMRCKSLIY